MADGELVVLALGWVRKSADAAGVPKLLESGLAAGDDLMGITLVADVPQELVLLEIEDVVQGQCQLDCAEIAG